MKKILIALDYDPTAQKVAESGFKLAKSLNAEVVLLHVVADATYYSSLNYSPIMGFGGFNTVDTIQTDTEVRLTTTAQAFLKKTKEHLGDENISTVVSTGNFDDAILSSAAELNADLIVMGTRSRHGLGKMLFGSVADNVLHHSSIPLFIVPVADPKN